jgi:hypothetical protein
MDRIRILWRGIQAAVAHIDRTPLPSPCDNHRVYYGDGVKEFDKLPLNGQNQANLAAPLV